MTMTTDQTQRLEWTARHGQPAHVRTKALVLLNLAQGRPIAELAGMFRVSRTSIYSWRDRFREKGIEGFKIRPGRGRKATADPQEIERYLRQCPRAFGVRRTRWTLQSLAQTVPSLKGFSTCGVQKALARAGFRYKRGQPRLHSPGPQYAGKKGLWTKG